MANAPHDQNTVKARLGVLFSDGVTLVPIAVDSVTNALKTNTTDTVDAAILALYENGKAIPRDENGEPAMCAESSADPSVLYPLFVDADGKVLIDM